MAITLRYWLRWTVELNPQYPLLPAYLGNGDANGIQFMEFPILNLLMAPLFSFGVHYGRILSNFFFIALNLGLTFLAYRTWKDQKIANTNAGDAFFVLPFISAAGAYFYKHIPDYTAFILITWAVGISFDEKKKNFRASFLLCALGVLIKPAQVIALAPLLLHSDRKFIVQSILRWIIPAGIPCTIYYTVVKNEILKLTDSDVHFGTHIRNPIESFVGFFSSVPKLATFFHEAYFGKFVMIPVAGFGIYYFFKSRKLSGLVVLLILQTLGLAILDGDHLFVHRYYLCGFGFVAALTFTRFTSLAPRWLTIIAFTILTVTNLERVFYDIRPVFKDNTYKQCRALKESTPEFPWNKDYRFRSGVRRETILGLCFGEREGSSRGEFGFILKTDRFPEICQKVKESKDIILMTCKNETEHREELRFY